MYAWCVSPEIMAWCGLLKTLLEVFQEGEHEQVEISFGNMHDNLEEEEMLEFVTTQIMVELCQKFKQS